MEVKRPHILLALIIVLCIYLVLAAYKYIFVDMKYNLITCDSNNKCPDNMYCSVDKDPNDNTKNICRYCSACYESDSTIPAECSDSEMAPLGSYCDAGYSIDSSGNLQGNPSTYQCPGKTSSGAPPTTPIYDPNCNATCARQGYCCPGGYDSNGNPQEGGEFYFAAHCDTAGISDKCSCQEFSHKK